MKQLIRNSKTPRNNTHLIDFRALLCLEYSGFFIEIDFDSVMICVFKRFTYRFLGSIFFNFTNFSVNVSGSIGWTKRSLLAGYFARRCDGRVGRFSKPPPQFGHTFNKTVSTHSAQNVHSKVQIMASLLSLGRSLPQCSQLGLSWSICLKLSYYKRTKNERMDDLQ